MRPLFEGAHRDPRFWGILIGAIGTVVLGGSLATGYIKWEDVVAYGTIPVAIGVGLALKKGLEE